MKDGKKFEIAIWAVGVLCIIAIVVMPMLGVIFEFDELRETMEDRKVFVMEMSKVLIASEETSRKNAVLEFAQNCESRSKVYYHDTVEKIITLSSVLEERQDVYLEIANLMVTENEKEAIPILRKAFLAHKNEPCAKELLGILIKAGDYQYVAQLSQGTDAELAQLAKSAMQNAN